MTTPALVALVGYVILLVVVMLPFDMYTYDVKKNAYVKTPYNVTYRLLIALLLCLPFFLGIYSVNCMMVGDCQLWSWIVAIATVLWASIVIMTAFAFKSFTLDDVTGYL